MKIVATVSNDLEASLITGRLREADIPSMQRAEHRAHYGTGPCSILVEDHDYERAREILAEDDGGFDEDELARLSEQAAQRARADIDRQPPQRTTPEPEPGRRRQWLRRTLGRHQRAPRNPFGQ